MLGEDLRGDVVIGAAVGFGFHQQRLRHAIVGEDEGQFGRFECFQDVGDRPAT